MYVLVYLFNPVVLFLERLVSFHDGWLHAAHHMLSCSLLLINLSLQLSYLLLSLLLLSKDAVNALCLTVILSLKLQAFMVIIMNSWVIRGVSLR